MSLMTDQEDPDKNQRTSEPVTKIKRERHGTRPHLIAAAVPALPSIIDISDSRIRFLNRAGPKRSSRRNARSRMLGNQSLRWTNHLQVVLPLSDRHPDSFFGTPSGVGVNILGCHWSLTLIG